MDHRRIDFVGQPLAFLGGSEIMEKPNLTRQVLYPAKASNRWFGIDFHADLYQGCPHGCIYCDLRNLCDPSADPTEITYKTNVIDVLGTELPSLPKNSIVSLGSYADPYNAAEEELHLTRQALGLIHVNGLGVALTTKSDRILRDVDLLKKIALHSPVVVMFPVSPFTDVISQKIEPHAPKPSDRFKTMTKLTQEGLLVGIKMMPTIPFINDTEANVLNLIRAGKAAGVRFIYPSFGVTLQDRQRTHFFGMLEKEFPGLRNIYMDTFGLKTSCISIHAPKLKKAFVIECKKQKILYGMNEIVHLIRPEKNVQMKLF
jgi:DNA repair photolyase